MHDTIPGHVNTSSNVAVCRIDEAGNLFIKVSVRSHELFPRDMLTTKHTDAARLTGFHAEILPGYPGYAGDPKNPLALLVDRVCQRQGGAPMSVIALHVGLELGILADKNPDLTVISVGPDARDAHTVTEQAPLNRFPVYARLLAGSLEELATLE
jgi:dipeptidase D